MTAATVDALIVSYNTRELLRDCLASLRTHGPPAESVELRISVFDNASADGSAEFVSTEFPDVRLLRSSENVGFGRANNELARTSESDYLLLLNSDTILVEDLVTPLLGALRERPDAALAGPRLLSPDGSRQLSSQDFPSLGFELALRARGTKASRIPRLWDCDRTVRRTRQEDRLPARRETDFLWATCWLIRRDDFLDLGPFDERFHMYDEDLDFCFRVRRHGRSLLYVPEVDLIHVGGASGTSASKQAAARRSRRELYRKHRGSGYALAYQAGVRGLEGLRNLTASARARRAGSTIVPGR